MRHFVQVCFALMVMGLSALSSLAQTNTSPAAAEPVQLKKDENPPTGERTEPSQHIAVILPLKSAQLGRLADALRLGFAAGAEHEGRIAAPYRIYGTDNDATALASQTKAAIEQGAVAVVGGLTREGANTLMTVADGATVLLALNEVTDARRLPDNFFQVSLSVDAEARLAAQAAFAEGARGVVVLSTASPLSRRVAETFEREWQRLSGESAKRLTFSGEPGDAGVLKGKAGADTQLTFYATDVREARIARPYLPQTPRGYGTSRMMDPFAETFANLDINGTRFYDMPWLTQPDHPAVAVYARPKQGLNLEQQRLYALGIDAYRLVTMLLKPAARRSRTIDGVTGKLTLNGNVFDREPVLVEIVDGRMKVRE